MTILDAHSVKVQDHYYFSYVYKCNLLYEHQLLLHQDSHYILRDPEDDAKLAKVLVEAVLIKTVEWPDEKIISEHIGDENALEAFIEKILEEASNLEWLGLTNEHESDEDESLPNNFPMAERFVEPDQLQSLIPVGDLVGEDLPVLADKEDVQGQLVPDSEVKTEGVYKVERKLTKKEKKDMTILSYV